MRKNSKNLNAYFFPQVYSSIITSQLPNERIGSLERYQNQMTNFGEKPLVNFRISRKPTRRNTTEVDTSDDIKEISKEISSLRKELRERRYEKKQGGNQKLGRILSEVEDTLMRNKSMHQPNYSPPMYVPVPFPMYMPQPQPQQSMIPQYSHSYNKTKDTFYRRTSSKKATYRFNRGKRNIKRFKKVVNCILFYFYLKRFCKIAQSNRRIAFDKFFRSIKTQINGVKKLLLDSLNEFFSIMTLKKEISFDFKQGDNKDVIKEKISSIRKLIGLILDSLYEVFQENINKTQLIESLYFLCRHGNYSCTQPLLTKQELQMSSISQIFHYVSCDKNLEKSSIMSFLFIKLLIYNFFLSPQKINENYTQDEIPGNLYVIASVLYELFMEHQDEIMTQVDPLYTLGNYEAVGKARALESIIVKNGKYREGDLISGLKNQEWISRHFKFKTWTNEKKTLRLMVDFLHNSICKYHSKIIVKYF